MRLLLRALTLLALGACADSYPGGSSGAAGDGGAPLPVSFPMLDLEVRSQLWAPAYFGDGLLPSSYRLYLLEEPQACDAADGLRLGEDEGWIGVDLVGAAVGTCDVRTSHMDRLDDDPPPSGCHAYVDAGRLGGLHQSAVGGSVFLEVLDETTIAGVVRLQVPERPVQNLGCWSSQAGSEDDMEFLDGGCRCEGPDGPLECESSGPDDLDCCDDGLALVEVSFPFEATRCADAGRCGTQPCIPYLVGSCRPAAAPPASCETACAAYVDTCRECLGCTAASCREADRCQLDACLETCRGLAAADPLVALSLACVEAAADCDGWASCVSSCGE